MVTLSELYSIIEAHEIEEHRYLMGCNLERQVGSNDASFDFLFSRSSPRGLTWEQELKVKFYHDVLVPFLEKGDIPPGVSIPEEDYEKENEWARAKRDSIKENGLHEHDPLYPLESISSLDIPEMKERHLTRTRL